jgi:PHD/YefM family antitoxin component YafN of YafNO toxin-antitoxin module
MTSATDILKAPHVGIKEFRNRITSKSIRKDKALVLTDHGAPMKVVIDYDELIDLIERLEDLQDKRLWTLVNESRGAVARGDRGIDVRRPARKK